MNNVSDRYIQNNKEKIKTFLVSEESKKKVIKITLRIMLFFGFSINRKNLTVTQVKPLERKEEDTLIGLFNPDNYNFILFLLEFLNDRDLKVMSALVFLCLCNAINTDKKLRKIIKKSYVGPKEEKLNIFYAWLNTQHFLDKYMSHYDSKSLSFKKRKRRESTIKNDSDKENQVEFDRYEEESNSDSDTPFRPACPNFRGLNYTGNSCYQDSTLVALFAIPNKFIIKNILERNLITIVAKPKKWLVCSGDISEDLKIRKAIQNELYKISNSIKGLEEVKNCTNLRKLFAECQQSQQFHLPLTQDAGEFLQYLFSIFEFESVERKRVTYVTNDDSVTKIKLKLKTFEEITMDSPIHNISIFQIHDKKEFDLTDSLKVVEDSVLGKEDLYKDPHSGKKYSRRIEINEILSASYLVFNVQRLLGKERNLTKIICPKSLMIGKKILNLFGIIVHFKEHYTLYIRCGKMWYYYNDIGLNGHRIEFIGSYEKMLKSTFGPNSQIFGTLYFYG